MVQAGERAEVNQGDRMVPRRAPKEMAGLPSTERDEV
jgi:hypothetical protein